MALNGIQIFKLTPKKNCKECGCPTCMAFSMKAFRQWKDHFFPVPVRTGAAGGRRGVRNRYLFCAVSRGQTL